MNDTLTITFGVIWIPIALSVICAAIGFWPSRIRSSGPMGLGAIGDSLAGLARLGVCIIAALIVWVVYLAAT